MNPPLQYYRLFCVDHHISDSSTTRCGSIKGVTLTSARHCFECGVKGQHESNIAGKAPK